MPQNDPLRDLIHSTLAFYARFNVQPQLDTATRVFQEEVGEFIEAAHDGDDLTHTAEEAADVIVTVIGLCAAAGVSPDKLIEQMYAVCAKNDAKTPATHEVNANGKISRKAAP
jgi:NTP pyrophosphatase (non-canonical NTP hydrolase)